MSKTKIDIGFVILHYQTIDDTLKCVDSILSSIDTESFQIVIVDNDSPNDTGKLIISAYLNNKKIHVIINKKNYGFSKGNNVGYQYIKDNYNPKYIAVLNNDTTISNNLLEKLESAYNQYDFYVLGPAIINKDGKNVNPVRLSLISSKEIRRIIKSYSRREALYKFNLLQIYNVIKRRINNCGNTEIDFYNTQINVQLNGAALFFSEKYILNSEGFKELTFMYFEEDILYYECLKNGYLTLYYPDIQINHLEESATVNTYSKKSEIFKIREGKKSAKILLKLLYGEER